MLPPDIAYYLSRLNMLFNGVPQVHKHKAAPVYTQHFRIGGTDLVAPSFASGTGRQLVTAVLLHRRKDPHRKIMSLDWPHPNRCHASSNRCLTSSNKKLVVTGASLLVTSALLVVTRS